MVSASCGLALCSDKRNASSPHLLCDQRETSYRSLHLRMTRRSELLHRNIRNLRPRHSRRRELSDACGLYTRIDRLYSRSGRKCRHRRAPLRHHQKISHPPRAHPPHPPHHCSRRGVSSDERPKVMILFCHSSEGASL